MKAPPVSGQPNVTLCDWIITKAQDHYFLVGYQLDLAAIRRSTPIRWINVVNGACVTQSGRRYELMQPHATGEQAEFLLKYFKVCLHTDARDATDQFFGIRNLRSLHFLALEDLQKKQLSMMLSLPHMTVNPMEWLNKLIGLLTRYDVDPYQLMVPLNLTTHEWHLASTEKLNKVTAEVALRGGLLLDIFSMTNELADNDTSASETLPTHAENVALRFPPEVLNARTMGELRDMHRLWMSFADIASPALGCNCTACLERDS